MKSMIHLLSAASAAVVLSLAGSATAQVVYTIENGSMALNATAIPGWDATSAQTRGCGPFGATVSHQDLINAPLDTAAPLSGSLLLTFTAPSGSLTQQILLNTAGQQLESFSVDISHDGTCTALLVGFYEENNWDVLAGGTKNIIPAGPDNVPADTDGTLDTFTTVTIPAYTVPNSAANPIRLFIGTAGTGAYGAATIGSKVAIDRVRVVTSSAVSDWQLY